jgi:predicted AlkP superfamily phosphohydrolase/phosphomutase
MTDDSRARITRRTALKGAVAATAAAASGCDVSGYFTGGSRRASRAAGKKVIIIGIDGMDPRLSSALMKAGRLPNLKRLSEQGGFSELGTSVPPQSPVAWATFINGAGPGSHGIFDFIHRHPQEQCAPFYSASETLPGQGGWDIGEHRIPLDFWPFNHKLPQTVLRRQGTPFWDYLDAEGVPSTFYDLPSNYPASPSQYGHHRCLCGMGTPDMLGTYGTYLHFAEDHPEPPLEEGGGKKIRLRFDNDTARVEIEGPANSLLKNPEPIKVTVLVHRDREANAAVLDVQGRRIVLRAGEWSQWTQLGFPISMPLHLPSIRLLGSYVSGICRFYLQEVRPNFRLYVSPVNMDPADPALNISEPPTFAKDLAAKLGPFYTTGFQEDHKARTNMVFGDDEYIRQAGMVLEERLALFEQALHDYEDGLLFFYFSSSDLQSHMFWWDSEEQHPIRTGSETSKYFEHIKKLYAKLDAVVGEVMDRHGATATILVMSDHGFGNFGRQFNLNSWLRDWGYLGPAECTSIMKDVDWSSTTAYGLGINGLYLNLKGRERDGLVEPGDEREALIEELKTRLEAVTDVDGKRVIRGVYRSDQIYQGNATALAPDLIIGYYRGFRASWATCLGELTPEVLLDNDSAWSADHCADALEVPGVLFSNRRLGDGPASLVDLAPSILAQFDLKAPSTMVGRNLL